MAGKVEIKHPFKELKVGGRYLYRNEARHFSGESRYDDKGKLLPAEKSKPVACTVDEFPEKIESGKIVKKLVVNFANTGDDVIHDLKNIPATGIFTEVETADKADKK